MDAGQALILQGNALALPLPDASIDLIVTSPPYWALRSYSAGEAEIGSEPTPHEYLEALWAATAEMMRVLKPTGNCFVDLGDKYAGNNTADGARRHTAANDRPPTGKATHHIRSLKAPGTPEKSLMLLPERYRVGCVDRLGLIARAVIIWNKPNGLPESVTDRVRRSHEDWVHLVKQPRYYSATDEVREPYEAKPQRRFSPRMTGKPGATPPGTAQRTGYDHTWEEPSAGDNPLGKLPGSVWSVPSEPLRLPEHLGVQHYAAFPSEWPRRLILGWSPPGICLECGQGRVPVVERERESDRPGRRTLDHLGATHDRGENGRNVVSGGPVESSGLHHVTTATILGYACSCTPFTDHPGTGEDNGQHGALGNNVEGRYPDVGVSSSAGGTGHLGNRPKVGPWREYHLDGWKPPPTRPAIVLDVFSGTGTTAMVARALGRIGVGVDLSRDYCRAARWRVQNDGAKAVSRTNLERQGSLL